MSEQPSNVNEIEPDADNAQSKQRLIVEAGSMTVGLLVILACVHVMYVAFLLYGSKPQSAAVLASLTQNGKWLYMPERELPLYVLGCAIALPLSIVAAFKWRSRIETVIGDPLYPVRGCIAAMLLIAVGGPINIALLLAINTINTRSGLPTFVTALVLTSPALLELSLFYAIQSRPPTATMLRLIRTVDLRLLLIIRSYKTIAMRREKGESIVRIPTVTARRFLADVTALLLLVILLYVPRTDLLAGSDFNIQSFHHWDFFAMGPAIGLIKGKMLATQVYSQYGIGWPLLLAKLDPLIRLSYGHTYKMAIIYGCIYYCGIYWLLRQLRANPGWALAGVLLAIYLQVFHSGDPVLPIWSYPSASILRTPCDVWVFLLLLAHWRSKKQVWLLVAGALVGLSLLFVIDTGLYLALIFVVYNLFCIGNVPSTICDPGNLPTRLGLSRVCTSLASLIIGAAVLFCGLYIASGPSVFSSGYVRRWLEVLWLYPSGISMLPIFGFKDGALMSYCLIIVYLGIACGTVIRYRFKSHHDDEVVIGLIALLGLFYLIYYIGRSHPLNLMHLSIPFSIVITYLANRLTSSLAPGSPKSGLFENLKAPAAVISVTIILFLGNTEFLNYSNVLSSCFNPPPSKLLCYFAEQQDVCVANSQPQAAESYQSVVAEMERLVEQGKTIAVIANDDTSLYVASRASPWCRYSPLLPSLMTESMLDSVDSRLAGRTVDYVYLLRRDPANYSDHRVFSRPGTTDEWLQLAATTRRCYRYDHICGAYEVWKR